jgi:DNA replication protein DnaC
MIGQTKDSLEQVLVNQLCKQLHLNTISAQFERVAQEANKNNQPYQRYLAELLTLELEERERSLIQRRIREAKLPRVKTLDEFDFAQLPNISAKQIRELVEGSYLLKSEPVIFIGECGTGKTHLASALAIAACQQKKKVRFVTAAGLVNELVEASHHSLLGKALNKWASFDLIVLDEVGYVPLAEIGAELLFQVVAERAEKTALIITTNLPFSEWTQVFTNARLCKALLDRIIDRSHIVETGVDSYRFKRTLEKRQKPKKFSS